MSSAPADLVLRGGTLLTFGAESPTLEGGWISVGAGRIAAVGDGPPPPAATTVDCSGDLIVPGFVNAHAHLLGAFVRGLGGDRWTRPDASAARPTVALRLAMEEDDAYAAARLAIVEMQLSGVTSTTDSQPALRGLEYQADGTLRALWESGMRTTFYRASVDRTEFFPAHTHDAIRIVEDETERLRSTWSNERLEIGIEPMALHRVTDDLLHQLVELAEALDTPLAIHGPYGTEAAQHAIERWNRTSIQVLADAGALGPRMLVHHPVEVDDEDIRLLAGTDTAVSVCTVDNMLIGTGPAPLHKLVEAGVRVGLGLDQPNDGHDMFELMKTTLLAHRATAGSEWASPRRFLEMATIGGARALGFEVGVIEPGKWADLVVLDGRHPTLRPSTATLSNLVLAAGPQAIKRVYNRGHLSVENGRHLVWDQDEVVDSAEAAMARCWERAGLG